MISLLLLSSTALADGYCKTIQDFSSAETPVFQDKYEIQPRFAPALETIDQRGQNLCYGFAAYYLTQYHVNASSPEFPPGTLSPIDLIAKGSYGKLTGFGFGGSVLQNLKKAENIALEPYILPYATYDRHWDQFRHHLKNKDFKAACSLIKNELLPSEVEADFDALLNSLETGPADQYEALLHPILDRNYHGPRISIPPYNIFVSRPKSQEKVFEIVNDHLKDSVPLSLSVCQTPLFEGKCFPTAHAVTVTGTQTVCYGKDCQTFWKIVDSVKKSLPPTGEAWCQAQPLADTLVTLNESITSIKPCSPNGIGNLPPCRDSIIGDEELVYLVASGDSDGLRASVKENNPSPKEIDSQSILTLAAYKGWLEVTQILVELGANVNQSTEDGVTPLIAAAIGNHEKVVNYLLSKNADPNLSPKDGKNALYYSILNYNSSILRDLAHSEVNLNAPLYDGQPALIAAAERAAGLVSILLELGADPNVRDKNQGTALHKAVWQGAQELIPILGKYGAKVDLSNQYGLTPIQFAVSSPDTGLTRALLNLGADIHQKYPKGKTLVELAEEAGRSDQVDLLKSFRKNEQKL